MCDPILASRVFTLFSYQLCDSSTHTSFQAIVLVWKTLIRQKKKSHRHFHSHKLPKMELAVKGGQKCQAVKDQGRDAPYMKDFFKCCSLEKIWTCFFSESFRWKIMPRVRSFREAASSETHLLYSIERTLRSPEDMKGVLGAALKPFLSIPFLIWSTSLLMIAIENIFADFFTWKILTYIYILSW